MLEVFSREFQVISHHVGQDIAQVLLRDLPQFSQAFYCKTDKKELAISLGHFLAPDTTILEEHGPMSTIQNS